MPTLLDRQARIQARILDFLGPHAADDFAESVEFQGAVPGYPLLIGAVFPLSLILLALDQGRPEEPALRTAVDRLVESLVLFGDDDGWRYFNLCPDIPPDADDLAQVITLMARRGYPERARLLAGPLERLRANARGQGRFRTWLVGADDEAAAADLQWAAGRNPVHPEVVANLLHALLLLDAEAWRPEILAGAAWLLSLQEEGRWASYWYFGHGYGTHQVLRLLGAVQTRWPDAVPGLTLAQRAAREALLATQEADGSWAVARAPMGLLELGGAWEGSEGRVLETALTLSALQALPADAELLAARDRAIAYLESAQEPDGGYPAEPYYFTMGLLAHQSRCLTAAAVLSSLSFTGHVGG